MSTGARDMCFSCMTEPHFSERSAALESYLRPRMCATTWPETTQQCLPNPCAFHSYASHLRFDTVSTGHFAQANGSWSPRLSGDRDPLLTSTSLYEFFFSSTSDEENSRLKKTEFVTRIAKCFFSHSMIHIRDRDVGSEDGRCALPI